MFLLKICMKEIYTISGKKVDSFLLSIKKEEYKLEQVDKNYLKYTDYIKCGQYIEELKTNDNYYYDIKLATSNQKIYKKGVDY